MVKKNKLTLTIQYLMKGEDALAVKSIPNWDNWTISQVVRDEYKNGRIHITVLNKIAWAINNGVEVKFEYIEVDKKMEEELNHMFN